MSLKLISFVKNFLNETADASIFCEQYSQYWKSERDSSALLQDDAKTSEALSSIFCLVDLFNPADDREDYEFDEIGLRLEISKAIGMLNT
jgi:hypothetical protein